MIFPRQSSSPNKQNPVRAYLTGLRSCRKNSQLGLLSRAGWVMAFLFTEVTSFKLNKRALEVMEWMIRERPYRPKELDYSYLLEFTTKYHGISHGKELFTRVPSEFQNELLYNNLVIACLDKGAIRLPLEYMKKMRELGHPISHLVFNRLIILHSSSSYVLAVEAFGRIGQLNRAEEIWLEMKTVKGRKTTEQFNSMISVYAKHGLIDKASKGFREMKTVGCQPNAITFRHLALGCLKAGLVEEAIKTLELGMSSMMSNVVRNSTPWLETTISIIDGFAEKRDVGNAEKLFDELAKAKFSRHTFVYNTLIKAYGKAKVYDSNLLKRMILGGARPDAESYSLMKLAEQFQT